MNIAQEKTGSLSPFLKNQRFIHVGQEIKDNSSILDVGCGSGEFKVYLNKIRSGIQYYGVDIKKFWEDDDHLIVANLMTEIPKELENRKFDYITALALIEHIPEPERLIEQSKKLLKKNGRIIITTPHPIGRIIHDTGARLGVFSNSASEEHEDFLDKNDFLKFAKKYSLKLIKYQRFLMGFNQIVILE